MASTLKIDTLTTPDGTGNITISRPIVADISNVTGTLPAISGANLTSLPAANLTGALPAISGASLTGVVGKIVQVVNVMDGAVATGAGTGAADDTPPLISELNEFMTLAITPTSATNKLLIEVTAFVSNTLVTTVICGLFQDSITNALTAVSDIGNIATAPYPLYMSYYMTSGTTSATTFRFRAGGGSASTTTFNGSGGVRSFGAIPKSSITITEIAV